MFDDVVYIIDAAVDAFAADAVADVIMDLILL